MQKLFVGGGDIEVSPAPASPIKILIVHIQEQIQRPI